MNEHAGTPRTDDGDPAQFAGLLEDSVEDLYENAPCGYLSTMLDGTIARVNDTFLRWTGHRREDLVGRQRFSDLLTAAGRIYVETHYAPLLQMQGGAREIALEVVRADGTRLPVLVTSVVTTDDAGNPLLVRSTVFDATDRQRYERELLRTQRQAREEARRAELLLAAATVLAAATGLEETLDELAQVAVPALGEACLVDVLDELGRLVPRAARHADPERQGLLDELRGRLPAVRRGSAADMAMHERRTRWSAGSADSVLGAGADERQRALLRKLGATGFVTVPLVVRSRVLGTMTVLSAGAARPYTAAEVALAEQLARQVALVLATAQRHEVEHRASHTLQASLLPRQLPTSAGLEVAVRYEPASRDVEVGGDFYDVVALPSGDVVVAVGDVIGHDMAAAATMGQLRSAVRALVTQADGPGALLEALQDGWELLDLERMATMVVAWLEPRTGALRVATAGHFPPLLVADGHAELVDVDPAPLLGAAEGPVPEWRGTLPAGTTMLMFTDGQVEVRSEDVGVGIERLRRAALQVGDVGPEALCDHVLRLLPRDQRRDDVALLAVRRRPPPS